jgi:hypothetical protein
LFINQTTVFLVTRALVALLASSLDKLNAREKELLENKQFLEGKREIRFKEVSQLEDSLKSERVPPAISPTFYRLICGLMTLPMQGLLRIRTWPSPNLAC